MFALVNNIIFLQIQQLIQNDRVSFISIIFLFNNKNRFYLVIIIQIKQFRRFEIEAKNYSRLESISFMSIVTPQRFVSMIKNIVLHLRRRIGWLAKPCQIVFCHFMVIYKERKNCLSHFVQYLHDHLDVIYFQIFSDI